MKRLLFTLLIVLFVGFGALSPVLAAGPRSIAQNSKEDKAKAQADFEDFCSTLPGADAGKCSACFTKDPPQAWTAIGCIPSDPGAFVSQFLGVGIGIAGGVAFLLIIFGGFQILTSAGNPEQLNAGRELVSSAIAGLLLIIFSVFILRIIGVNILGIPEFK